jgi:hypothetical protein
VSDSRNGLVSNNAFEPPVTGYRRRAASCYVLGTELYPAEMSEPSMLGCKRLLTADESRKRKPPRTLFVAREQIADMLTRQATHQNIEVVSVPETELMVFIGEARRGYSEHMRGSAR